MEQKILSQLKEYAHKNDFVVKGVLQQRAQGVLNFAGIRCTIENILQQEYTELEPKLNRVDFICDAKEMVKNLQ